MDLTFQVPIQNCSFQHQTLLSPPDTSTAEHYFHFGPVASSCMELLVIALCSSLVAYQIPSDLEAHLLVSNFFAFSYCSWGSRDTEIEVVCHPPLQWAVSIFGGSECHGSQLHWVVQAPSPGHGCGPRRGGWFVCSLLFSLKCDDQLQVTWFCWSRLGSYML